MTDALEHFTKGSIVALICVAAILKFILSKRDEKTGIKYNPVRFKVSSKKLRKFLKKIFFEFLRLQNFRKRFSDIFGKKFETY